MSGMRSSARARPLPASEFGAGPVRRLRAPLHRARPGRQLPRGPHRAALREVIDAEKPAHTDYHLCFVEPRLRVGFQARLGIDAIVGNGPAPLRLGGTHLWRDSLSR